ncbi:MAG: cytochrome c, partial [Dehalococcoidia bacterium]|nr:cytochrome c [Dehalococcoidia bacterium]
MQSVGTSLSRCTGTRKVLFALSLMGLLPVAIFYLVGTPTRALSAEDGQAIFQQKCAACHTIGGGDLAGPDLKGVTARRDREWLTRWISAPDKMLAEKDPIATELLKKYNNMAMPNMGVSEAAVAAMLTYLGAQSGTAPAPGQPQPAPATPGNPATGEALFVGATPLHNGGPPCMACHSIAGIGALGGGALGPDLTQTFDKYGNAGMASV